VGVGLKFKNLDDRLREDLNKLIKSISAKAKGVDTSKPTVLLVDDSDSTRRINKIKLTLDGFEVVDARDGVGAIKALDKAKTPDVVVIDMHVKEMDGLKVLSLLRRRDKWKGLPAIVFSSNPSLDLHKKFRDAGANEFLKRRRLLHLKSPRPSWDFWQAGSRNRN
jgi:CheY-like chemotaxis protein